MLTPPLSSRLLSWARCQASVLLGAAALAASCRSAPPPKSPSTDPSAVVSHAAERKPTLVTIEREADPHGALALVAAHGGDSHTGRALAKHLEKAIFDAGWPPSAVTSMVFADAIALRLAFSDSERARAATPALLQALQAPADAEASPESPAVRDDCGIKGTDLSVEDSLKTLGVRRIALGAVASSNLLDAVVDGYDGSGAWPQGSSLQWSDPSADAFVVEPGGAAPWLTVSLHTPARDRVTDAARRLRDSDSTLALLTESWSSTWQLERTTATFRPGGACLAVRLSASQTVEPSLAGYVARAVHAELERAVELDATPVDPRLEALSAVDPAEAATRAAWQQLTAGHPARDEAVAHVTLAGVEGSSEALRAGFDRPTPSLPLEVHEEPGQGRLWALLSSPCATLHETASSAGHTAAALISAAQRHPAAEASQLQPWLSNRGLGLVGTVPAHHPDAPDQLAEAIARALLLGIVRSHGIAATRSELSAARPPSPSWDLALKLATEGRPSLLVPYGTEASLAELSPLSAERSLRAFLSGPLQLTVLAPHEAQGQQLAERLERLLSSFGRTRSECPNFGPPSKLAGEYVVADGSSEAVLLYSLDPQRYDVLSYAARWLNGPAGWLRRAVERAKLATTARAFALGSPNGPTALGISIRADSEALGPAIMQVRALLRELARVPLSERQLDEALSRDSDASRRAHWPPTRLLEAAFESSPAPEPEQLREFFGELSDERLVLVRPPTPDEREER